MIEDKIRKRSDNDLLDIMENYNQYQEGFVIAAYHELKSRKINFDDSNILELINRTIEKQEQIEENEKKQKIIIENLHPNIKRGNFVLITIILIRVILLAFVTESSVTIGFISIPYLSETITIVGLGLIVFLLRNGHLNYRYLFLMGFLFSLFFEIILGIEIITEDGVSFFTIFHLIFIGIRFLGVYFFFNKETNNWYKEIKNVP